jgi:laminin alpha 1/2
MDLLQFIPSVLLVNERPGAQGPSKSLLEFTKARFIRLRFQKLQTLAIDQSILGKYNTLLVIWVADRKYSEKSGF